MRKRIKLIPAILMLMAGAITSIICYILKYEVVTMLWVLLVAMILFYMFGDVIRFFLVKYVYPPNEAEEEDEIDEESMGEGSVIEKEVTGEHDVKAQKDES